jgi:hypothetical protein
MYWLLNTPGGRALIGHLSRLKRANSRKGFTMPMRQDVLKGYVRSAGGVIPLCKRIVAKGTTDITSTN